MNSSQITDCYTFGICLILFTDYCGKSFKDTKAKKIIMAIFKASGWMVFFLPLIEALLVLFRGEGFPIIQL